MIATKTIPTVMVEVGDLVATGFVTNLARPIGDSTGVSTVSRDLTQKRLEGDPGWRRFDLHPVADRCAEPIPG